MDPSDVDLPQGVADLVERLAGMRGATAVVLGGSRALGTPDAASDWDLGVYYRGELDWRPLAELGDVHAPGRWGRIMNGGAWLSCDGAKVDVLFRDLDFVERCCARAREGEYDVDALLGYVAGLPTYSLMAEVAVCRVLRGALERPGPFPEKLRERGAIRWRIHRDFSLAYASRLAIRADAVPALGQVAKAVLEEAHAQVCAEGRWVLNEKCLVERAGLEALHDRILLPPADPGRLPDWISEVARLLAS